MRAAVYHGNRDLRLETVPEPDPPPGEVKFRVDFCAICATDIEEYVYGPNFIAHGSPHPLTGKSIPLVPGHEVVGTVVDTADGVDGFHAGDRVVVYGTVSCGNCRWCRNGQEMSCPSAGFIGFARDGGLAEYMTWPASKVIHLPDSVSSRDAALVEPTSVAVLGTGAVGLLVLQVARAAGAQVYAVDRRQMSLDMAMQLGAEAAINSETSDAAEALRGHTEGEGVDVVFDTAGAPTTPALAVDLARSGGTVVAVAIYTSKPAFDFNTIVAKQLDFLGSMSYTMSEVKEAVGLVADGKVKTAPLASEVIGLDQVVDVGYARMLQPTKDFFRILVDPSR